MTFLRCSAPDRWLICLVAVISLAGCGSGKQGHNEAAPGAPGSTGEKAIPDAGSGLPGTPMAERVAVIGILNKRNGLTRDLQMKPGQALRWGSAVVRLRACEQTAPWENIPETGAFVQVDIRETRDNKWHREFSGWLFKNRPERNVVQHPIYDVWVKSCTMSWPETGEDTVRMERRASSPPLSSEQKSAVPESGSSNETPVTASPSNNE